MKKRLLSIFLSFVCVLSLFNTVPATVYAEAIGVLVEHEAGIEEAFNQSSDSDSKNNAELNFQYEDETITSEELASDWDLATPLPDIIPLSADDEPGSDLLLCGFNVLSGKNLQRKNIAINFINRNALEGLGITHYTGGTLVTAKFTAMRSMESMMSSHGLDTSFDIGAKVSYSGLFKASAEAKYGESKSTNYSYSTAYERFFSILQVYKELGQNSISQADLDFHKNDIWNSDVLSSAFKNAIETMEKTENNVGMIQDFFMNFGTHVITSYNFGGYAECTVSIVKTSATESKSIEDQFDVGAVIGGGAYGFEASIEMNNSVRQAISESSTTESFAQNIDGYVVGGSEGHAEVMDPTASLSDYSRWLDSIKPSEPKASTEILIDGSLELVGIWELIPNSKAQLRMQMQAEYMKQAQKSYSSFLSEYIYSKASIPVSNMPKPEISNDYVLVSTPAQFDAIRNNPGGKYILTNDIDLSGYSNWAPISFSGTLEGNGNTVKGVTITGPTKNLFGGSGNGTIKNLAVSYNTRASYVSRANGIAGDNATVDGCFTDLAFNEAAAIKYDTTTSIQSIIDIPATAKWVLIDLSSSYNFSPNKTITVPSTVDAIKFKGGSSATFLRNLNLIIQGDSELILENINLQNNTNGDNARPLIEFLGDNPSIISISKSKQGDWDNTIFGRGRYETIRAAGNLFIGGGSNLTIDHNYNNSNSLSASPGSAGGNAIYMAGANSTLDINIDGNLLVKGGAGQTGSAGADRTTPNSETYVPPQKTGGGGQKGSPGLNGTDGTSGGAGSTGGAGGYGIRSNKVIIIGNSVVTVQGGAGGTGGRGGYGAAGGTGGKGGQGSDGNFWNTWWGGEGGDGGTGGAGGAGGTGGTGGYGGTPLVGSDGNPLTTQNLEMSPMSRITLISGQAGQGGAGGSGGGGGSGGAGGEGGNGIMGYGKASSGSRGNQGPGGAGGAGNAGGRYNGSLAIVGHNSQNYGGYGGSGGSGGYGYSYGYDPGYGYRYGYRYASSGSPGTSYYSSLAQMTYQSPAPAPMEQIRWTQGRITFNGSVARNDPGIHNGTLTYHQGEVFDISGFKMRLLPDDRVLSINDVNVFYDLSSPGLSLVTILYYTPAGPCMRYVPIKVEPAEALDVELVKPNLTNFIPGSKFNNDGLAIEIIFCGGGYDLYIPTASDIIYPAGITFDNITDNEGRYPVTVTYTDPFGTIHTLLYVVVVSITPERIAIRRTPDKTKYYLADTLIPDGMMIRQYFIDGSDSDLPWSDVEFNPTVFNRPGNEIEVSVTYTVSTGDGSVVLTDTFFVEVVNDAVIENGTRVLRPPNKTTYFVDEWFEPDGLVIEVEFASGRIIRVPISSIVFSPIKALDELDDRISARWSYGIGLTDNIQVYIPITVLSNMQTGIKIDNYPDKSVKTTYFEGEQFEPEGMKVSSVWNNPKFDMEIPESGYTISGILHNEEYFFVRITENATGLYADIPITIKSVEVVELRLIKEPDKTTYIEGEIFDPTGMVVEAYYNNDSVAPVTDYKIEPDSPLSLGVIYVTVSMDDHALNIPIEVTEVKPTAVVLNKSSLTMTCDSSARLIASVLPDNVRNKSTIWSSSNPGVASVDDHGLVTALKEGIAVITVATEEEVITAECAVTVLADSAPLLSVSSIVGLRGNEVEVAITLKNNPGVTAMRIDVGFDPKALTFLRYSDTALLKGPSHPPSTTEGATSPLVFAWEDGLATVNNVSNGNIVLMRFLVSNDAEPGNYDITLSYLPANVYNVDVTPVHFNIIDGSITVLSYIPGDVNEDSLVSLMDATITRRYASSWTLNEIFPGELNPRINLQAADVNVDGLISLMDATIIRRHASGWEDYAILPWINAAGASIGLSALSSDIAIINVAELRGTVGDIVEIPISLENNPGITAMRIDVEFDDTALKFIDYTDTAVLKGASHPPSTAAGASSPVIFAWEDGLAVDDNTTDGIIVALRFEILEGADGIYDIIVSYAPANVYNAWLAPVHFDVIQGAVVVIDPGEICDEHDFRLIDHIDATCTDEGYDHFECAVCGESYKEPIEKDPSNHVGGTYENVITPATLTVDGLMGVYCAGCGELIETYAIQATISDTDPLLSVSSNLALRGTAATVDISIANNPGFAGMVLKVGFPRELTLTRYALGNAGLLNGFTGPEGVSPGDECSITGFTYFVWGRDSDYTQDGTLLSLTFEVAPDAVPGEYLIAVSFEQHDGSRIPVDLHENHLDIFIANGAVVVMPYLLGNVTDSGVVGPADLVRLARWIAGHDVFINELAADINGDGEIGPTDLVRLARWIAGHFGGLTLEELRIK